MLVQIVSLSPSGNKVCRRDQIFSYVVVYVKFVRGLSGDLELWFGFRGGEVEDGSEPVPMNRFRPSAVIAGTPAWAEDDWHRVRIGPATFRVAKPCGRCQVTTTDQFTGERGREPLMMLGRRRKFGQQLVFGQNAIPETLGTIRVGDEVQILD